MRDVVVNVNVKFVVIAVGTIVDAYPLLLVPEAIVSSVPVGLSVSSSSVLVVIAGAKGTACGDEGASAADLAVVGLTR
ncbi:hypothetical protein H1R20_g10397, partial [Candolleomyces eurysporus]